MFSGVRGHCRHEEPDELVLKTSWYHPQVSYVSAHPDDVSKLQPRRSYGLIIGLELHTRTATGRVVRIQQALVRLVSSKPCI